MTFHTNAIIQYTGICEWPKHFPCKSPEHNHHPEVIHPGWSLGECSDTVGALYSIQCRGHVTVPKADS